MQYVKLIVDRGPMEKIAKAVPAYEVPFVVAQYGQHAVHANGEMSVSGFSRSATEEFNRLRKVYLNEDGEPIMDGIFGRFGKRQFDMLFQEAKAGRVDVGEFLEGDVVPDASDEAAAEAEADDEPEEEKRFDSLDDLTKAELLQLAQDRGIDVPTNATKAQIIDALDGDVAA